MDETFIEPELTVQDSQQAPNWEEFREQSARTDQFGNPYFVVEWDLPTSTDRGLKRYYSARVKDINSTPEESTVDKSVLHLIPGKNIDDVSLDNNQLSSRYCIDTNATTGFRATIGGVTGPSAQTIIDAMVEGTRAWEQVANVRFKYDSGNNNNCGVGASIPDSTYIKVSRLDTLGAPCAFGPKSKDLWTCTGLDRSTIGVNGNYMAVAPVGITWPGTMMHELGHTLGLHHEHLHSGGGCGSVDVRDLSTLVDNAPIMGYPTTSTQSGCSTVAPKFTALSKGDGVGARELYGMPAAWYMAVL